MEVAGVSGQHSWRPDFLLCSGLLCGYSGPLRPVSLVCVGGSSGDWSLFTQSR